MSVTNLTTPHYKYSISGLSIASNLNRKKSISVSVLPHQNGQFLTVPFAKPTLKRSVSDSNFSKKSKSFESLRRIATETSLQIPENFSFQSVRIETYKIRWALLVMVILYTALSYMQWIQYSIIANIVMEYYNVSYIIVDWLSLVFMVTYIVLIFPVSYLMDCRGLRYSALIGSIGTAAGAWIKVFSINADQFMIAFLGQTIVAISQVFVLIVPARLASEWFKAENQSKVCSATVFAGQVGTALGFLITPMIVSHNHDEVRDGLCVLMLGTAIISTIVAVVVAVYFESSPANPPTYVQAIQKAVNQSNDGYIEAVKRLLVHKEFMKLVLAYGLNVGVFNAFSTLLNQIVLGYFPNSEQDAGKVGLSLIIIGAIGSLVFGYTMDVTHKFKEIAIWVCKLGGITMGVFCLVLEAQSRLLLFIASFILGFFMLGFQPIGYEYAAEITFPEPDNIVGGIMNISTHIFGVLFTLICSEINSYLGDLVGNLCFALLLFASTLVVASVQSNCKRHYAHAEITEVAKELAQITDDDEENAKEFTGLTLKIDTSV
ncbi:uncharacterized MFS-type transporter C09D4.1-like [Culicoides brevitarsis]|uniref:uncharacterized MFS-type transporter C09D4.1-like n=1 Tax=Culicoides brevitarsis TaxID=469753 RepID=UPI00307B69D0